MIRRLVRWAVTLGLITGAGVVLATYTWPLRPPEAAPQADLIICLGGGMEADGTLDPATIRRVETCAALFEAGRAGRILHTGGRVAPGGPAAGDRMMALAVRLGVPEADQIAETQAHSTLQNALFSKPLTDDASRVILVTEAFHLPRSWLSFRWAGFADVRLHASERVRDGGMPWMLLRETAAIWFNAARIAAWQAGALAGVPEATRTRWLQ